MASNTTLTPEDVQRYSRHIIMPQVGSTGQRKLLESKVLVVGAGGLGSPVCVYLTLAGVGTLGIVDFDVVDLSNLQRQILHQTEDVGRPKVDSAADTLKSYNPNVNVVIHEAPITSENAMDIIPQYDIVINGADNFPARYLVNDACYIAGKPLVDGSILLFDGQATVYIPGQGCYRCLFPAPPPPGEVPSCAEAGVIGKPDPIAMEIVKAFISLADGVDDTPKLRNEIIRFAREKLSAGVAPRELEVIPSLPKTRSGKIMRRLLKARELGLPEGDTSTLEDD